jgi:hypothetical protein
MEFFKILIAVLLFGFLFHTTTGIIIFASIVSIVIIVVFILPLFRDLFYTCLEYASRFTSALHVKRERRKLLRSTFSKDEAQSLLIKGILEEDSKVVDLAIKNGADINQGDDQGITALMIAARGQIKHEYYYRDIDEASCVNVWFVPSSPKILQLLLNNNPTAENVQQSYTLAQIGGEEGNYGPWNTNPTHIDNTDALKLLLDYMKDHQIDASRQD